MGKRGLIWAVILFLFAVTACAPRIESFPTLADQGKLALSTTNPYLGANLFLSKELERSSYLFNFFKGRGAPTALELIEPAFKAPRMLLFYPGQREVYMADMSVRKNGREWIVRGPFAIERQDYRDLALMQSSLVGEPVFLIWGKQYRFRFQRQEGRPVVRAKIPEYQAPQKKTKKMPVKVVQPKVQATPTPTPVTSPTGPLTSDQEALFIAKGLAPKDAGGNLAHRVKATETLEKIAEWYTGSAANAAEIAQSSGIASGEPLKPGTKINIPAKLAKQDKLMPSE